jgi:hypothetical protein
MSIGDLLSSYDHLIGLLCLADFGGLAFALALLGLRDLLAIVLDDTAVALLEFLMPVPPLSFVLGRRAYRSFVWRTTTATRQFGVREIISAPSSAQE